MSTHTGWRAPNLRRMSLRQRFLVAPLLGLILLCVLLAAFFYQSQRQNALLTKVAERHLAALDRYTAVFVGLSERHWALYELLIIPNHRDEETFYTKAKVHLDAIHGAIADIRTFMDSEVGSPGNAPAIAALEKDLPALTEDYRQVVTKAVEMATVDLALASSRVAVANDRFVALNRSFAKLLEMRRQGLAAEIDGEVHSSQVANLALALTGLGGAGLLLALSVALSRILARNLEAQIDILSELGDQSGPMPEAGDEIQRIARAIESFRQTQERLRDSEQRFRSFFEHSHAVMLLIEPDSGRILAANESAATFYGYPRERLTAMTIQEINTLPPHELAAERQKALTGSRKYFVFRHRLADGQERIVEVHATSIESAGDRQLFSIIHDITERQQAEEALRKSQQLIQSILDHSSTVVFVKDVEGRYLLINRRFEELFHVSQESLCGQTDYAFLPAETADVLRQADRRALAAGHAIEVEEYLPQDDGMHTYIAVKCPLFNESGTPYAVCGIATDITERMLAEAALREFNRDLEARVARRTAQLEAANRAKSDFLATMSHEIRTPMNTVLGMAHLALRTSLNPKQRDYVEKIHASGQHLLDLIDSILDLSKIEAGRLELEAVEFNFAALMHKVTSLCSPQVAQKGLHLQIELDPAIPRRLCGDPLRLCQILINYTGNAVKFTEVGQIILRARVEEDKDRCCLLRFEVQDTGIGMNEEEMEKVFHVFQQADTSTTRNYGGTGLGLAINKQLALLMSGEVGVDSRPGEGSTFWFTVRLGKGGRPGCFCPECDRADSCWLAVGKESSSLSLPPSVSGSGPQMAPAAATSSAVRRAIEGSSILVADDHPFNQQVARELLEEMGATVCVANNGDEAIELLLHEHFDCVLMDVQMPKMDGLEATRRIRERAETAGIAIIAMTANAWNQDRERCLAAGMNDFIGKPIQPDLLYSTLAGWLPAKLHAGPGNPPRPLSARSAGSLAGDPGSIDLSVPAKTLKNDPVKLRRVVSKFIEATRKDVATMEAALAGGNLAALGALGHRIKSPARALGAAGLADLCQALEALESGGDPQLAGGIVAQVRSLLERISCEVDAYPLLAAPREARP